MDFIKSVVKNEIKDRMHLYVFNKDKDNYAAVMAFYEIPEIGETGRFKRLFNHKNMSFYKEFNEKSLFFAYRKRDKSKD